MAKSVIAITGLDEKNGSYEETNNEWELEGTEGIFSWSQGERSLEIDPEPRERYVNFRGAVEVHIAGFDEQRWEELGMTRTSLKERMTLNRADQSWIAMPFAIFPEHTPLRLHSQLLATFELTVR